VVLVLLVDLVAAEMELIAVAEAAEVQAVGESYLLLLVELFAVLGLLLER
jgi:hypothetical protein